MRGRWNARHQEAAGSPTGVNPWLAEHSELMRGRVPGRALDVACGRGGNAFFLANLGLQVDAVDLSDVAVAEIRAREVEEKAGVEAQQRDLESLGLPDGAWDVIVMTRYLQRSLFEEMAAALNPGGAVLVETFLQGHRGRGGKPFNPDFTLEPGELKAAFSSLEIVDYREQVDGRRALAGIVARRIL